MWCGLCQGLIIGLLLQLLNLFCYFKLEDGIGGTFRTSKRSVMINDKRSVADIVESAHVVGKKSTVFQMRSAFDSLMKHT